MIEWYAWQLLYSPDMFFFMYAGTLAVVTYSNDKNFKLGVFKANKIALLVLLEMSLSVTIILFGITSLIMNGTGIG